MIAYHPSYPDKTRPNAQNSISPQLINQEREKSISRGNTRKGETERMRGEMHEIPARRRGWQMPSIKVHRSVIMWIVKLVTGK